MSISPLLLLRLLRVLAGIVLGLGLAAGMLWAWATVTGRACSADVIVDRELFLQQREDHLGVLGDPSSSQYATHVPGFECVSLSCCKGAADSYFAKLRANRVRDS